MFHWHGDTFDLPKGAALLASSRLYPHQAFRIGRAAYGVQFHPEITTEMVDRWVRAAEPGAIAGEGRLREETRRYTSPLAAQVSAMTRALFRSGA